MRGIFIYNKLEIIGILFSLVKDFSRLSPNLWFAVTAATSVLEQS